MIFMGGEPVDAIDEAQHASGWCGCRACGMAASGWGYARQARDGEPETGEAGA